MRKEILKSDLTVTGVERIAKGIEGIIIEMKGEVIGHGSFDGGREIATVTLNNPKDPRFAYEFNEVIECWIENGSVVIF